MSQFILSLDFELMWGVRDHRSVADYGDAVLGVREALPLILKIFQKHGIRATWATVGLLFARNREEMLDYAPKQRPSYDTDGLSPYSFITKGVGRDEAEDPLHFGRSLLDQIAETEGQEIGTHTFSHYYCLEKGQDIEAFSADIEAARAIAANAGHTLKSIVFPRNQMTPAHIVAAANQGITTYRGNPKSFAYRPRAGNENTLLVRGVRFLDGVVPVAGRLDFDRPQYDSGSINVPASRFLRPYNSRLPLYSKAHLAHVQREMTRAAMEGKCYHLWWHPHNMGRQIDANIAQLDQVIQTFVTLRENFGMQSANMTDMDDFLQRQEKSGERT